MASRQRSERLDAVQDELGDVDGLEEPLASQPGQVIQRYGGSVQLQLEGPGPLGTERPPVGQLQTEAECGQRAT